ncbi:MAG: phytanoyl-CoA dioxygenase family protein [Luminiphilus sp.]|nr:phytanoyl-CoA dioxygenase family protein [Luminiphilus sp.]
MHIQELTALFHRDGYIALDGFFNDQPMAHLDSLIHSHYGSNPGFHHDEAFLDKSQTDVIPWFPKQDGVQDFDAIENDPGLQSLTDAILGEHWDSQYCMVMFSKQGSLGQAWHQDCSPENSKQFNLNRLVYTADITDDTGGQTVVVPGSHRNGLIPPGNPVGNFQGQVVLQPKKGTLVLLHGHTWHRVLPIKGAGRVSTNFRAVPASTPDDITDICIYRNMRYQFSTSRVVEERSA